MAPYPYVSTRARGTRAYRAAKRAARRLEACNERKAENKADSLRVQKIIGGSPTPEQRAFIRPIVYAQTQEAARRRAR